MKTIALSLTNILGGDPRPDIVAAERSLSGGMARTLIALIRLYQSTSTWVDAKAHNLSKTDLEKLGFWGFVQVAPLQGRQKKPTLFAPSNPGFVWAQGTTTANSAVLVWDGKAVGFVQKQVSVDDVIGGPEKRAAAWAGQ